MRGPRLVLCGALGLGVVLSGCAGGRPQATSEPAPEPSRPVRARHIESSVAVCAVGERPKYFVPGPAGGPLALLGCARLGVSGKRVEFSANLANLDGARHSCINPAYRGHGLSIPAICKLEPPLSRFAVRDAARPPHHAYVIWGTAGAATGVVARYAGGTAQAAVLKVKRRLARRFGEPPFGLFVAELPVSAACAPVTVAGEDGPDVTARVPAQTEVCATALPRAAPDHR